MREAARRNICILTGSSLWSEEQRLYRRGGGRGGRGGCTLMRFCLGLGDSADDAVQEPEVLRMKEIKENWHVSQAQVCVCVCGCSWNICSLTCLDGQIHRPQVGRDADGQQQVKNGRFDSWEKGRSGGENEWWSHGRWWFFPSEEQLCGRLHSSYHFRSLVPFKCVVSQFLESWECVKRTCMHSWSASAGRRRRTLGPWRTQVRRVAEWMQRAKYPHCLLSVLSFTFCPLWRSVSSRPWGNVRGDTPGWTPRCCLCPAAERREAEPWASPPLLRAAPPEPAGRHHTQPYWTRWTPPHPHPLTLNQQTSNG